MPNWGQGAQGAAGGAMAGGAFGGPLGAVIGGGVGGLAGLFGGGGTDEYQDMLMKLSKGYGNRTAPQADAAAQAGASQLNTNRAALIAQLEAQARGEGPSAAQNQMREAMDRAAGAQSSAAAGAGGRGVNSGAAYRNAANNTAAVQAQGARDSATLRSQEQLNATGQLGGVIGQGINSDNALSTFNSGQSNDMARANLMAKLQTMGLNDEAQLRALLGAGGMAGPGMGTQLLAGGANAVPGLLQYKQQQAYMDYLKGAQGGGAGGLIPGQYRGGPITNPSQV